MSWERFEYDRTSIGAWIKLMLSDPKPYNSECVLKLDQTIFPFDDFQITPLSAAAYCGDEEAVRILLKYPNPHEGPSSTRISPLFLAFLADHSSIVNILKQANAEHDESDKSSTIMHVAARKGMKGYIRNLNEEHNVQPDIQDADGIPSAVHALYQENEQVWETFSDHIDRGARTRPLCVWNNSLTYTDLARAMGKSKALVDLLEDKCRYPKTGGRT
ncbi:hypothetical protein NW761_012112 [Fusarium oxysporum]|nr:hypothetical protein NW758_011114 [Fusarium oxysporum]KAJ4077794.1 hypothetical protein NW761_012112 [Fusarium oxysporum]